MMELFSCESVTQENIEDGEHSADVSHFIPLFIIYLDLHFVVSIRRTVLYSMLCQQTRSIYDIFDELISDLQQAVFNLFVELLIWIHLTNEFLEPRLC